MDQPPGADTTTLPAIQPGGCLELHPPTTPRVSILIVNFNGARWLGPCLESLKSCTFHDYEIIVVDNASTDDSREVLRPYPDVRLVANPTNRGFAGGNNDGLPHCRGEFILLLNNDTRVTPGFLEPLVDYLDRHPNVGVVQSRMHLPRHGGVLDTCGSYLTVFGFLYHVGYWKPDAPCYHRSRPIFTAKGACLMFRRSLLPKVGGFLFEDRFFCYYEETDFCHRVWLAGAEVHFVPDSVIDHLQGATAESTQQEGFVLRHYLRNQTFALLSNLSARSLARILPLYAFLFFTSLTGAAITGRGPLFRAHTHAMSFCLAHRNAIHRRREVQRAIRVVSDRDIFAKVLRTPRWTYFWRTFQGRLAEYQDLDLDRE